METRQKQRVSGLRFVVYDRPLHPELFEIHHDHRIVKGPYEARIWVTGVSHVIGFYVGGSSLTELIAPVAAELPIHGRLMSLGIRGEKDRQVNGVAGLRYLTSFQLERMGLRVFRRTCADLTESVGRNGIFVPFPRWTANGLAPFTYVDYQARASHLHVFAYHAFPDELAMIRTQSLFELV